MVKNEYKEKIVKLISQYFPKAKIVLFGSRATGEHSPSSDIDVSINLGTIADEEKMAEIRLSIDDLNIPLDIDVLDYHAVPEAIQKRINQEQVIWKN